MNITIQLREISLEIHSVTQADLGAILHVYQQCEDFLALGPVPTASMEMVLKDIEVSQSEGSRFCGIYKTDVQVQVRIKVNP